MGLRTVARCTLLVALFTACTPNVTISPSPSPTASPSTRPHFELASYQYTLQVRGKIRVGTQEDNPPFSEKNANTGEWSGFDVDLARELARAIYGAADDANTHIDWVPVNAATRLSVLTGGNADVVIQTLAVTDENAAKVDLSDAYFHTGERLLVKKSNGDVKEVADLADGTRTVCTQRDAAVEQDLRRVTNNGAKILLVDSYVACLQALQTGAADAVAANEVVLASLAQKDTTTELVGTSFGDRRFAIGVKKNVNGDRQAFVPFLNDVIARMVSSGTWAKLYEKDLTPVTGDKKQSPD